jgi:hypothetical protein
MSQENSEMQPVIQPNTKHRPAPMFSPMKRSPIKMLRISGLLSLTMTVSGCGYSSDHVQELTPVRITAPSHWNSGNTAWQQCPVVSESDQRLLDDFFRRHPAFSGSPEFMGEPMGFSSGTANRRFIWLRETPNGTAWSCIEFVSGKFLTSNGEGIPWQS